jgi:excisionase family DNA binding protein
MFEQNFIERLAQSLVARMAAMQNGKVKDGAPIPRLMNTKRAAAYLGLSVSSLQHLKHRGKIPFVQINRRVMYDRAELEKWIGLRRVRNNELCSFTAAERKEVKRV